MKCEECSNSLAKLVCQECKQALCQGCDSDLHKGGKRRTHQRFSLCGCGSSGPSYCLDCNSVVCPSCELDHKTHGLKREQAFLWDLDSIPPTGQRKLEGVDLIRGYTSEHLDTDFDSLDIQVQKCTEIDTINSMLLDMSAIASQGFSHIRLITSKAVAIKTQLLQLQTLIPGLKIDISLGLQSSTVLRVEDLDASCPVHHPFPRRQRQTAKHDHFLTILKDLADQGHLVHEAGAFLQYFGQKARVSMSESSSLMRDCEKMGFVQVYDRAFGGIKTVTFLSLKLDTLSLESLIWSLRSLQVDEMLPTERAVQSRMKEAFDFKPSALQWMNLLETCRKTKKFVFRDYSSGLPMMVGFDLKESVDPVTGCDMQLLYFSGMVWKSMDQYTKGDTLGIKDTEDWLSFNSFMESYFVGPDGAVNEECAISGGRYGCSQFIKSCALKQCSLGRISYMVQLAINEDLLRYHKTLLVWNPMAKKKEISQKASLKLNKVKRAIVEILKAHKGGVSLAQLPLWLKKKLSFSVDVTELGFAKLKDLLGTLPTVKIEPRGNNHPFAVLRTRKDSDDCSTDHSKHSSWNSALDEEEARSVDFIEQLLKEDDSPWGRYGYKRIHN